MMDFNIDIRKKQLQSLDQFISSSRNKVQSILDYLGWTSEKVLEGTNVTTCTVDPLHKMPEKSLDEHITKCTLRNEGYDLKEEFLSEPINIPGCSLKIDNQKKMEIITEAQKASEYFKTGWNGIDPDPRTSDRLTSTFSSDERLALFNYVTKHTTGPPKPPEFNVTQPRHTSNRELTEEELMLQERNAKRRRIKYKSVHTNKKNHTEVLREVIDSQMELYKEWFENGERNASRKRLSSHSEHIETSENNQDDETYEKSKNENSKNTSEREGYNGTHNGRKGHTAKRKYQEDEISSSSYSFKKHSYYSNNKYSHRYNFHESSSHRSKHHKSYKKY